MWHGDFLFSFGVIIESEDDKEITLSVMTIIDDLVFFNTPFINITSG